MMYKILNEIDKAYVQHKICLDEYLGSILSCVDIINITAEKAMDETEKFLKARKGGNFR